MRSIDLERNTKETQIKLSLNLDGSGSADLSVELPFFAHMLDQLVRHGFGMLNLKENSSMILICNCWKNFFMGLQTKP